MMLSKASLPSQASSIPVSLGSLSPTPKGLDVPACRWQLDAMTRGEFGEFGMLDANADGLIDAEEYALQVCFWEAGRGSATVRGPRRGEGERKRENVISCLPGPDILFFVATE